MSDKEQIGQRFTELTTNRPKPLSDWEKTRQDVLGIKAAERRTTFVTSLIDVCHPGMISEVVWHVLGQNGCHFSELPAKERVTVAITLGHPLKKQGANPYGSGMGRPGFGRSQSSGYSGEYDGGGSEEYSGGDSSDESGGFGSAPTRGIISNGGVGGGFGAGTGPMGTSGGGAGSGAGKSPYRDYLLLGDLHMKQGKPAQASKAYESALATLGDPKKLTVGELKDASTKTKHAIYELHQKLAQAALANDQAEVAKTWVEKLIALKKGATSKAAPKEEAKRLALPGRVIISAEKSLLDQVGSNIPLDDFKTRAKVEHLSLK